MNALVTIIVLLVKTYWCWSFSLYEEIETNPKTSKFEIGDRVRITNKEYF